MDVSTQQGPDSGAETELKPVSHATVQRVCFVCGEDNPAGLHLTFEQQEDGALEARWTPALTAQGYPGLVHGGLLSTVLDEAMSKSVAAGGVQALTAEMKVRYRRWAKVGEECRIRGWVVARKKRLVETEATLTGPDGVECAHAWGSFLEMTKRPE